MQKTAYEMRISDWSSDVCSSDLVVGDAEVGKQGVVLEHQPDRAGFRRPLPPLAGHHLAVDDDAALLKRLQAGGDPQRSGLAAAGRPEQADDLAALQAEAQVIDRPQIAEGMADVLEGKDRKSTRLNSSH